MKPADEMPRLAVSREDDERFMREALAEARAAAEVGEVPIGAVVVHEGTIIARAHNRRELDEDPSAHAEFLAMMQAARTLGRWRLSGCTVYVTLEPCLMCSGLMVNARIDRCVYGATDPKGGALGTLYDVSADPRLNHAFPVASGILEDECAAELRSFFRRLRGAHREEGVEGPHDVSRLEALEGALGGDCGKTPTPTPMKASAAVCCPPMRSHRLAAPARKGGMRGPLNVVLAIDSFKGCATSSQVEMWLAEGMCRAGDDVRVAEIPVADGGEGTVEALRRPLGGEVRSMSVPAPVAGHVDASYLLFDDALGRSAVIEMAQAAGIGLSSRSHEAACAATTRGVGELIADAVSRGAETVYVGLGGSATVDGGVGMLQALGACVLDASGGQVVHGLYGVRDIDAIDLAPARAALAGVRLVALSDVKSPLVGPRGAVRMFGPQKGLGVGLSEAERDEVLAACDGWMAAYGARLTAARDALDGSAEQVGRPGARPKSLLGVPGSGAAGGLGAALLALGAELVPGIEAVLGMAGFDDAVRSADLVVTGEGAVDAQTAQGKVPVGVARRAKRLRPDVPVIAVCGSREDELEAVYAAGVDAVLPVGAAPQALDEAMDPDCARRNLRMAGETVYRLATMA